MKDINESVRQAGYDMAVKDFNTVIATHHLRALVDFAQMNKDKVVKEVMEVEKMWDIACHVITDKGLSCKYCGVDAHRVKRACRAIIDHFAPPEGKGISENKVFKIIFDLQGGTMKQVAKEISKAHREGRL